MSVEELPDCPECGDEIPPPEEWEGNILTHCPTCDCPFWTALFALLFAGREETPSSSAIDD